MKTGTGPLLETRGLALRIGARVLVERLDFSVAAGECWCVLGPNGSGKTTLLHTVVGLRACDGGTVLLAGRAATDWNASDAARLRAFLPQGVHDAFSATVLECTLLGRHPHLGRWAWESDADRSAALAALAEVDLDGFAGRDVLTLSGGERQRVAIAALLVQDTPLLFLDEPVTHLDLHHQMSVLARLRALAEEGGRSVLFSLHDLNLAARFATHVLMIMPGGMVRHGPIAEVMNEADLGRAFAHRVVRFEAAGRTLFVPE